MELKDVGAERPVKRVDWGQTMQEALEEFVFYAENNGKLFKHF